VGDIVYTPTFHNVDYVDGEDRVRAEGANGFNARFGAIESDLAQLSTVVSAIDAKLDQLEAPPPPPATRRLTLPLRFIPVGGLPAWAPSASGSVVATPGQNADGVMNLLLPDGVLLRSLRAVGQAVGPTIRVNLFRVGLAGGQSATLATFPADDNPFDVTAQISGTVGSVDTGQFRYYIDASCGITAPDTVTAVISALQLTFSD